MTASSAGVLQRRRLGRTGHESSLAILGGIVFDACGDDADATSILARCLDAGVNQLDVAPGYGAAEEKLGRVLPQFRDRLFVASKTAVRDRAGAWAELKRSLRRLGTERLDLYQLHGVTTRAELAEVLAPGGAAEALVQAKEQGLASAIGITGHFEQAPAVFLEALDHLDLDTVMFPVYAGIWSLSEYRRDAERLLAVCVERDVGAMAIKAGARRRWPGEERTYRTWYEPVDRPEEVRSAVRFTLSVPGVTAFVTPGDAGLLPAFLDAARSFGTPLTASELVAATSATDQEVLSTF